METRIKNEPLGQISGNGSPAGALILGVCPKGSCVKSVWGMAAHKERRIPVGSISGSKCPVAELPGVASIKGFMNGSVLNFYPIMLRVGGVKSAAEPIRREKLNPSVNIQTVAFLNPVILCSGEIFIRFMWIIGGAVKLSGRKIF